MRLRPETRDSVLVAFASLAFFGVLYRERLHFPDAKDFLAQVHAGDVWSHHFLYLRIAGAWHRLLTPLGCSPFVSTLTLSLLGGAIAVFAAHRTLTCLGVPRGKAVLGAWLVATCPAVFYFATTVEIHAPFLAVANLAWWSAAAAGHGAGARAAVVGAVRTGALTALATGVHATGHLLLWPLLLLTWRRGRSWISCTTFVAAHAVVFVAVAFWATGGSYFMASAAGFLRGGLKDLAYRTLAAPTLWREWLLAFAPLSFVALGCLFVRRHRVEAALLHVSLLPYLVATVALLHGVVEFGAYLVPLALPYAWLGATALSGRWLAACLVVSFTIGIGQAMPLRQDAAETNFAADVRALNQESPIWLMTASLDDMSALARGAIEVPSSCVTVMGPVRGAGEEAVPLLCAAWDQGYTDAVAQGRRLVLTASALEYLRDPNGGMLTRMMADIDRRYDWLPVQHGTFRGFEARRK